MSWLFQGATATTARSHPKAAGGALIFNVAGVIIVGALIAIYVMQMRRRRNQGLLPFTRTPQAPVETNDEPFNENDMLLPPRRRSQTETPPESDQPLT